jgi:Mn-containing catalase
MLQASWEIAHLKKYYKAVKSLSPRENHDAETTNRIILQANTSGLGTRYYQIFSPVSDEHSTWSKEKGFNKQIELDQAETKGSELIPDELLSELQQIRSSHKSKLEENMRSSPIVEDGYYDGDGLGGLTEEQRSFLLERGFLFQIVDGSL